MMTKACLFLPERMLNTKQKRPFPVFLVIWFFCSAAIGAAAGAIAPVAIPGAVAGGAFQHIAAVVNFAVHTAVGSTEHKLAILQSPAIGAFSGITAIIAIGAG